MIMTPNLSVIQWNWAMYSNTPQINKNLLSQFDVLERKATLSKLETVQTVDPVMFILEITTEYEKFNKTQKIESDFDKKTKAFLKAQKNKGEADE